MIGLRKKWLGVEVVLEPSTKPGVSTSRVAWPFGNVSSRPTSHKLCLSKLGFSLLLAVLEVARSRGALLDGLVAGDS